MSLLSKVELGGVNLNIGIIDADLIGRKNHRFPNLACMKLSGYYKEHENNVELISDWELLKSQEYDKVYMSKVFTDTEVPDWVLELGNIEYGGTGFYYDKAAPLPHEIEHHMPDYHLYDEWVNTQLENGIGKPKDYKYYTDFSIGFTTRGCFRQCEFCVNKNYNRVYLHSPIEEFLDKDRKNVCLLDDNILGFGKWKSIIEQLQNTKKPFEYKQGMDLRLMTEEKAKLLSTSKYIGDYIFAFDNIADKPEIEEKLKLWRKYCNKTTKLYVFCGFDRNDVWDYDFWVQDLRDTFERIKTLMKYGSLPYIMRFNRNVESPYVGTYINLARWCNQPNFFKKKSYREFCEANQALTKNGMGATMRYMTKLEKEYPEIAQKYYDLKFENIREY